MKKLTFAVSTVLAGASLLAAPKVSDATLVRVSPMGLEPTIDGNGYRMIRVERAAPRR